MNILVCVKQVPDLEAKFVPNADGSWFDESGMVFRMNEYDAFAVEAALRIRESTGGQATDVTVLSIGPQRTREVILKAIAMGADHGVHILDPVADEREPWQIAAMIAGFAASQSFDLLLTGMQSSDRGSAQVGLLVAELLGITGVSAAVGLSLAGRVLTADRELEGGAHERVRFALPALVTCQLGLNSPRYPTLPGIMKSKKAQVTVLNPDSVGLCPPFAVGAEARPTVRTGSGEVLEGPVGELADRVAEALRFRLGSAVEGGAR